MRFVVRYADAAELDIAEIFAWYETQSGGLGTEFLRQLKILEAKLERYPEINAVEYNEIRRAFTKKFPICCISSLKVKSCMSMVACITSVIQKTGLIRTPEKSHHAD